MKNEDIFFIILMLGLAALAVWKLPIGGEPVAEVSDNPNSRDTIGASSEPENTDPTRGPRYLVYNMPWLMDVTIARFVAPRVTPGALGNPKPTLH